MRTKDFFLGRAALKLALAAAPLTRAISLAMSSPTAGAAVRPGDCIPAALYRFSTLSLGPRMKSPVLETARRPANSVIAAPMGRFGISLRADAMISFMPLVVTAKSSLDSCSLALGPMKVLPWVVVHTKIPLDFLVGQGNTTP